MPLLISFYRNLVVSPEVLNAERQDFNLDDFEMESRKWKRPHSEIFSYSEEPTTENL